MIEWKILAEVPDLQRLIQQSAARPCLIFKHSTRCEISRLAKSRLERDWNIDKNEVAVFYLDVIDRRAVSNEIEQHFKIRHESPQVLLISNEVCIYNASHVEISFKELKDKFFAKN